METAKRTHQLKLFEPGVGTSAKTRLNGTANKLDVLDRPFHDWYRFVLSFPPHLVREYIDKFDLGTTDTLLDPFCGTGTTVVESQRLGIKSVGIEANPIAHFAASVKTNWRIDADELLRHAQRIAELANSKIRSTSLKNGTRLYKLQPEKAELLLRDSIDPSQLHQSLILLEQIVQGNSTAYRSHEILALAKALVFSISNLHFGPEVGVRKKKVNAPVIDSWLNEIELMVCDLTDAPRIEGNPTKIFLADSREMSKVLAPNSISAVFTSPPYPNEKDYTRTTRLESVILGFINSKDELRALKRGLVRSNTRGVYKADDDDKWVADNKSVQKIANAIEDRRIELGKTSGFEKLYPRVTRLYFGGMARHLSELREFLKPGAKLGYVVGDQASYLRVMIRTGQLIGEIAESLGYTVENIDLFRTRHATATREQIREEVVVLSWPGTRKTSGGNSRRASRGKR
jgi:DNA modification methylase